MSAQGSKQGVLIAVGAVSSGDEGVEKLLPLAFESAAGQFVEPYGRD